MDHTTGVMAVKTDEELIVYEPTGNTHDDSDLDRTGLARARRQ